MKKLLVLVSLALVLGLVVGCPNDTPMPDLSVVEAPVFTPASGEIDFTTTITLSTATEGATIYYTVDGSEPTTASTSGTSVDISSLTSPVTVKAIAVKEGMINSSIVSATYTKASVANPVISLLGSDIDVSQEVEITSETAGASIYYTLDGTEPATSEKGTTKLYNSASKPTIALSATITALAVKEGMINSAVEAFTKKIPMVAITGGEFTREDNADITVSNFYLGEIEVTQGQWQAVMGMTPSFFDPNVNLPVEQVSWYEAVVFCNTLSQKESATAVYYKDSRFTTIITETNYTGEVYANWDADGYRLPTEAEWEYAAGHGGYNETDGKPNARNAYSGTDNAANLGDYAWYTGNSGSKTHIVGTAGTSGDSSTVKSGKANALGLYDMSGNVWEWCWDRYGNYDSNEIDNPTGPASGSKRVFRGGAWSSSYPRCRVSFRFYIGTSYRLNYVGFRVARSL